MTHLLNDEGWARMKRLEQILATTTIRQFVGPQLERRGQFDWLRDWVLFSLFVDLPPMRPQNGELEILERPEYAGSRRTNGLVFFKSRISLLQIVCFKNATFLGEHVLDLPESLREKLLAYMRFVCPAYQLMRSVDDDEELEYDDEDEEEEEDSESDEEEEIIDDDESIDSSSRFEEQMDDEVKTWRTQSTWLFL